jgi:CDP-diacylglycerol--serine O-phosphatidyltransferase
MKIYKLISIADIFTLVNALMGFSAILLVINGQPRYAIYAILVGILADGLDGILARRFSRKWYLGDYLDVMADTTSFCVAPAVVVFATVQKSLTYLGDYAVVVLFAACGSTVVCGLLRLARFTYMSGGHSSTFVGLPSPGNALVLMLLALQFMFSPSPAPSWVLVAASFVLAGLMITDYRWPKVKGAFAYVSGAVIFLVILTRQLDITHLFSELLLDVALLLALAYAALGPAAVRWRAQAPMAPTPTDKK